MRIRPDPNLTKCADCPFKGRKKVSSIGDPDKCKYVLIGEAPGRHETNRDAPFVGETGNLLQGFLNRFELKLHSDDFYLMNAMSCMVRNKNKVPGAVSSCRERVKEELRTINKDATIVVMGVNARNSLFGEKREGILSWRGWQEWEGRDVFVTVHPSYYLYNPDQAPMLLKDIKRFVRGKQPQIGPFVLAYGVELSGKYGGYVWVSKEDLEFVKSRSWHGRPDEGYVEGSNYQWLHREIASRMGLDQSESGRTSGSTQVDHLDRNRRNCTRANIRITDLSSARLNRAPKRGGKFKGTCYTPNLNSTNPWIARAAQTHLGYFATEVEAARAYDDFVREHYKGQVPYVNFPRADELVYTSYILDTHDKVRWLLNKMHSIPLEDRDYVAIDLETDQVDFQRDRILCVSITLEPGTAYIIPDSVLYLDGHEFVTRGWSKDKWESFLEDKRYRTASYLKPDPQGVVLLNSMFALKGYRWVGQNSKFDIRFLRGQLGVTNARCDEDTIHMHYILDERSGGHGLKPLADDYFDVGDYEHGLFDYITKKSARYSGIPRNVLYKYNAMDTEVTYRLAVELEKELREQGLWERPYRDIIMPADSMLLDAELKGVFIDWKENRHIEINELYPEVERLTQELRKLSGMPTLNPNSSVVVNNLVYDKFKFPIISARTRAGGHQVTGRSTQKAIMDAWDKMYETRELNVTDAAWEFIQTLKQYRHLRKLLGSYIRKWRKFRGTDDRVHTSYLIRGTVTGRLSATDPPMQTIPSKVTDRWGPMVANMHIATPGWKLMYADYSQAELMVLAALSQDELMLKTFKEGADYHSIVATAAYGENFTRDERQASKKLTFGWAYGGNVKEIALDALQFDGAVANRFAGEWDNLFAGAVKWRREQGEKMIKQGYVESPYGRLRRQLLLTDKNVGKARRIAINAPIQSAVSDFTLISATRLYNLFKDTDYARVILLIHDSLIMEVRDDKLEEVQEIMEKVMIQVPKELFPDMPFRAEVKISHQLGDLT